MHILHAKGSIRSTGLPPPPSLWATSFDKYVWGLAGTHK